MDPDYDPCDAVLCDWLKVLIYLWIRDGSYPLNTETENYITQHIEAIDYSITNHKGLDFTNEVRAAMAGRIVQRLINETD